MVPSFLAGGTIAVYAFDVSRYEGIIPRNIELDGQPVGGVTQTDLRRRVADAAASYQQRTMTIQLGEQAIVTTLGELGFQLDVDGTMSQVLSAVDSEGFWSGLVGWLTRFQNPAATETLFSLDPEETRAAVAAAAPGLASLPAEPSIRFDGDGLALDSGRAGRRVDVDATVEAVLGATTLGPVVGVWTAIPTDISPGDAIAVFTALVRHTESGLILFSEGVAEFVSPTTYASWIKADAVDGEFVISFDGLEIYREAEARFFGYSQGQLIPEYEVVDGMPKLISIDDSRLICCEPSVVQAIEEATLGSDIEPVEIPLRPANQDESAGAIERLGVVDEIGTFTTFHSCCQNRVVNIHRIADLTRGVLIMPGEQFSVNEFVGRRTRADGFVEGGVIYQGRFETDVGGGISQYATTLFNAAFFGGLDIPVYQSHSIYLDRYPYGREATLSYPEPDLVIENLSAFAVLVWPTYDDTSITVTLYSTVSSTVTEVGQSVDRSGPCTRVTTYREREFEDGTVVKDSFFALYRPSAGYFCDELAEPAA